MTYHDACQKAIGSDAELLKKVSATWEKTWNKEYREYSNKQYEDYLDFCKKPHETDSNQ